MNPIWKEALGAAGARFNDTRTDEVDSFGDAAGELVAARYATVVAPLTHLGVIRVGGEDAKSFLHNQLTSDINHLAADGAHRGQRALERLEHHLARHVLLPCEGVDQQEDFTAHRQIS